MPDNSNLNESLIKLEDELNSLASAGKLIQIAKETSEKDIVEIRALVENVINEAKAMISDTNKSAIEINNTAKSVLSVAKELHDKIDKVDFPSRLTKIDDTVAGININVANTITVLNNIERNLQDKLGNVLKEINLNIEIAKTVVKKRISVLQLFTIIAWFIQLVIILFILLKK